MAYCNWGTSLELLTNYHDTEWGFPIHDDRKQFEYLMMEVMQCGLNWTMMMKKREIFRACFNDFDYEKIALYTEDDIERIINYPGMIRSQRKIEAVITNAKCFLKIREEFGSFDKYLWNYSDGKTILYNKHGDGYIPVSNGLSDEISKDLRKRGFKYLGTVTVYSHLQACGMINDHGSDCPCYKKINESHPTVVKRRFKEKQINYFG